MSEIIKSTYKEPPLNALDRSIFRRALAVLSGGRLVRPTITVTGDERYTFPEWVDRVVRDTIGPTGTLELEFIRLLEKDESYISSVNEMIYRAADWKADLGLRHALVFLSKYYRDDFGLPTGTYVPLPGTIVMGWGRRYVPYLHWDGGRWTLVWYCHWLDDGWFQPVFRFLRPRASKFLGLLGTQA